MGRLLVLLIMIVPFSASAGMLVELGGTYFADTIKDDITSTSSRNFYNLGVLFNWNKTLWAGWSYMGVNSYSKADESTTFASQDTGPMLKWQFGRDELYCLTGVFNILAQANYSQGTVSEKWSGTSFWASFSVMPEIADKFHVGVAFNYYAAAFSKKSVDGAETNVSNSKTFMYPSLLLTKSW